MPVTLVDDRRPRRSIPLLILFGLILSLALPLTASAQFKDDEEPAGGEYEALGLVADGEYESPQFGYSVEWSTAWDLDPFYDPPLISDEDEGRDDIKLAWFGDDGEEAYVNVIGWADGTSSVEADFEMLSDPDSAASFWGEDMDAVVLLDELGRDSGAVLFALVESDDDDQPAEANLDVYISLFVLVELEDGTLLHVTLSGDVAHFAAAYEAAEDVLIEGEPIAVPFDGDDIAAAMDEAVALSAPDAADAAELAELGMVDDGEYESSQFGYAVEWSNDWGLDEYYAVPLVSDAEAGVDEVYLDWRGERVDPAETAYVVVSGQANGDGVDDTMARWTGEEYAETWGEHVDADVILEETSGDTGVVLYSLYREDTERQYYKLLVVVERKSGEVLYLTLNTHELDFESGYDDAAEILVDGEPLLTVVAWDDIEEAIEDAA